MEMSSRCLRAVKKINQDPLRVLEVNTRERKSTKWKM